MDERFATLPKIVAQPAARLLALSNASFDEPVTAPAAADVGAVLAELDASDRPTDMIRLLSVALPVREGVWWACLAGRDRVPEGGRAPKTLTTAEAWAFEPTEDKRKAAREALDAADPSDPTVLCAMAVAMCDGKLGPGELAQYDGPPGASQTAVFGMNMLSLGDRAEEYFHWIQVLIERGLDIARGGNGTIDPAAVEAKIPAPDPDDLEEDEEEDDDEDDFDDDDDDEDIDDDEGDDEDSGEDDEGEDDRGDASDDGDGDAQPSDSDEETDR